MIPKHRPPTTPGEVLREEFLVPKGMSQTALAMKMGVPIQLLNGVVAGRRAVTPKTAILLSRVLGTTAEFWMNLQTSYDLWQAQRQLAHVA